jgi:hypothetical protein
VDDQPGRLFATAPGNDAEAQRPPARAAVSAASRRSSSAWSGEKSRSRR